MPRNRFDKLEPPKQEAILAAAAAEFAERGFGAASLNRIIERAESSKGALYYYFEDKADLFATVVERAVARVMAELEWPPLEEFTAENYWDRLRDVTRRSLKRLQLDTWYMRILWAFHRLAAEPAARDATARVLDQYTDITRAFFRRGQELGVLRTDLPLDLLVEMFLAADQAGDRWLINQWAGLSERDKVALVEARMDLARDMLDARNTGWER